MLKRLALAGVVLVLLALTGGFTVHGNTQTEDHWLEITFRGWIMPETFSVFGNNPERLEVLGEAENLTAKSYRDCKIRGSLYDSESHVLNMKEVEAPMCFLSPHSKMPFAVIFYSGYHSAEMIGVEISCKRYSPLFSKPWKGIKILDSNLITDPESPSILVVGVIKSRTSGDANVIVTLYNEGGDVVGVGHHHFIDLAWGEEDFFRITIESADSVADYFIQTESC